MKRIVCNSCVQFIYFQDSWYAQIFEKFRKERKHITDPEDLQKKRKHIENGSSKKISKVLRRGGINWEPAFPEGEDESLMNLHQRVMQDELKKRSPNLEKIQGRMALTFPHRRTFMNEKPLLSKIKEVYPALFSYKEVNAFCNVYIIDMIIKIIIH